MRVEMVGKRALVLNGGVQKMVGGLKSGPFVLRKRLLRSSNFPYCEPL